MPLILKNLDAPTRAIKADKYEKLATMIEDDDEWYMDRDIESTDIVEALFFAAEQLREAPPAEAETEPPKT